MDFKSLRVQINNRNTSVKDLVNDIYLKIDSKDPEINSYICTTKENAIAQAEFIDQLINNEDLSFLNQQSCGFVFSFYTYPYHLVDLIYKYLFSYQ